MHEQLWLTEKLNHLIGGPVSAMLNAIGIHPHDAHNPITDPVAMQLLVAALLLIFFIAVRARLSVDNPGKIQHVAEMIHEAMAGQSEEIIGHEYKRFVPYIVTIGLFILVSNLLGLIPGFLSPTQFPSVPLGFALATFVYYHFHGFRQQGFVHYMKHFAGPVPWLAPLMFPIEIISHSARVMSLTIRLYANMYAGEMVTLAFFSLVPVLLPVAFLGLHLGVSLLQAYIFVLLTMIYLSGAVAEEEH
ncbi:MAG TPA: F0F1 ATP synthase subunit A [Terriglobales bacterium]|nr:F0F1 ATP synthase subunit A [Terriglobales bacterium]